MTDKNKNIKELLSKKLDASNVKVRQQAGVSLSYLEGWFVQQQMNDIFGYENWHQNVKEIKNPVPLEQYKNNNGKTMYRVGYSATVRVEANIPHFDEDGDYDYKTTVVREDVGFGNGVSFDPTQACELAIKEAVTDAMKRACKSFGNQFGLPLYDKEQKGVLTQEEIDKKAKAEAWIQDQIGKISEAIQNKDKESLAAWIANNKEALQKRAIVMPDLASEFTNLIKTAEEEIKKMKDM